VNVNDADIINKRKLVLTKYENLMRYLNSLADLEDGWDSYGASAPASWTLDKARRIIDQANAKDFLPDAIVPDAEGGVALYWFGEGDKQAYLNLFDDGENLIVCTNKARTEIQIEECKDDLASIEQVFVDFQSYLTP